MKTQSDIEKRLQKLRKRYRQKYVQERTGRHHLNCVHNYKHISKPLPYSRSDSGLTPERMYTRPRTSLNVVQEDEYAHICTYGSDRNDEWNGDLCDDVDNRAPSCPWFKPSRTEEDVAAEFDGLMSDVEFVFENYRDMATLQWVLDIRSPDEAPDDPPPPPPTLWRRFVNWLVSKSGEPRVPQLPPAPDVEPATEPNPEVPKGLWDADSQDPRS